ncbi:hypothetical protein [Nocardia terpenica]|uniref:Uncharacterized protein n=1 Tax=Nocardia terpenica TaxID=455432 RepID=A0A6G9Z945_9NOCA|nr:hypothetical protein [Nocardia terpenica]QIS22058.1 hypothetical protein F6W96_30655 [Nocardia terpenica]
MSGSSFEEAEDLLRTAYEKLNSGPVAEPLTAAATHLVRCALDGMSLLNRSESTRAREMLGCARAAVTTATYMVREVDGLTRRGVRCD